MTEAKYPTNSNNNTYVKQEKSKTVVSRLSEVGAAFAHKKAEALFKKKFSGISDFLYLERTFFVHWSTPVGGDAGLPGPNLKAPIIVPREQLENLQHEWVAVFIHWTAGKTGGCSQLEQCGYFPKWLVSKILADSHDPVIQKQKLKQQQQQREQAGSKYPATPADCVELWRSQMVLVPHSEFYDGPPSTSTLFDAYSSYLPIENDDDRSDVTLHEIERGMKRRFELYSFTRRLKTKHDNTQNSGGSSSSNGYGQRSSKWWDIKLADIPQEIRSLLLLLKDADVKEDFMSYMYMLMMMRFSRNDIRSSAKTSAAVEEWLSAETALLSFRLQTSMRACASRLFLLMPSVEAYMKRNPKSRISVVSSSDFAPGSKLGKMITTFDRSVTVWLVVPFELMSELVGKRSVILACGNAYVPPAIARGQVLRNFRYTLSIQTAKKQTFSKQEQTQLQPFYILWRQIFETLNRPGAGSSPLAIVGHSIIRLLDTKSSYVPRCISTLDSQGHLEWKQRVSFSSFMIRAGASPNNIVDRWREPFTKYYKSQGRNADSEIESIRVSLNRDRSKFEKKYPCNCRRMMTIGVCPYVKGRMGGEQDVIRTCLSALAPGTGVAHRLPDVPIGKMQPIDLYIHSASLRKPENERRPASASSSSSTLSSTSSSSSSSTTIVPMQLD